MFQNDLTYSSLTVEAMSSSPALPHVPFPPAPPFLGSPLMPVRDLLSLLKLASSLS